MSASPDNRTIDQIFEDLARHKRESDEAFARLQRSAIKLEVLEELERMEARKRRFGLFHRR